MPKVVVVYLSTSGNTKAMADAIVEGVQVKKKYTKAGSEPKRGDTPIMHEVNDLGLKRRGIPAWVHEGFYR